MGDVNVVKFLLEKAEDKNPIVEKVKNWTLLHAFADEGNLEMCRLMIGKVKDKSPQDINGQTPYYIAASHLMDKNSKDQSGQTPCHGHLVVLMYS